MKNMTVHRRVRWLLLLLPIALALLASLPACHKEPNKTIIHAHFTEYGTGKPIAGARLYLWCDNGQIFGPSSYTFFDSLVTDEQGLLEAEYIDRDLCGGIYLSAYKEGYYYKEGFGFHTGLNEMEIVLDPEAWLKLVTIPDLGVYRLAIGGDFLGTSGFEVIADDGTEEHLFQTSGNRMKQIFWRPWGELDKTVLDSIFVSTHDTTTYTIHY